MRLQRFEYRPLMIERVAKPEINGISLERQICYRPAFQAQVFYGAVHLVVVLRNQSHYPPVLPIGTHLSLIHDVGLDLSQKYGGLSVELLVILVASFVPFG